MGPFHRCRPAIGFVLDLFHLGAGLHWCQGFEIRYKLGTHEGTATLDNTVPNPIWEPRLPICRTPKACDINSLLNFQNRGCEGRFLKEIQRVESLINFLDEFVKPQKIVY